MKKSFVIFLMIGFWLSISACAVIDKHLVNQIVKEYSDKGQQFENAGDLPGALEQYKLALTVDPKNNELNTKIKYLKERMQVIAETHYMQGLNHQQKGEYQLAQNEFLQALRYQPDHRGAMNMLKPGTAIIADQFVVHTVKPNESISKIAMIYYGDYKKFPIIARFNNMTDATKVNVGDLIKVPKIQGIPFMLPDKPVEREKKAKKTEAPHQEIPRETALKKKDAPMQPPVSEPDIKPDIEKEAILNSGVEYRDRGIEYFNEKKYSEAIIELEKSLSKASEDKKTIHYLYLSHLQRAMVFYEKGDFLAAKKAFDQALHYNKDCDKCSTYSVKSEQEYKELHYNNGIAFFGKEQLTEAIHEWELVTAIDPDYKKVKENITKARQYLERLEEIQKGTQQ